MPTIYLSKEKLFDYWLASVLSAIKYVQAASRNDSMMYHFLDTCKLNDIEPFTWLKETLTNIEANSKDLIIV